MMTKTAAIRNAVQAVATHHAAGESTHEALYKAITGLLYDIHAIRHPGSIFPSLADVELCDYGTVVEVEWRGECVMDHNTVMDFCKARKCTLNSIREAFRLHDYTPAKLKTEEQTHLERHGRASIIVNEGAPLCVNIKRACRKLG